MDDDQQFCLRWNNHQSTLVAVFDTLLENGVLVDCTLAAEGKYLNAHKVVLSACSPYFEALLSQNYDKHPIFILKDVKYQELKAMMDYMYRGEVNISQDQLGALLKAAESLQIKGLSDSRKGENEKKTAPPPAKSPPPAPSLPKVQGLTIEQRRKDLDENSRDGSQSPGPRRRKRARRRSGEELENNHDASNSSESHHSTPAQNIPSLPVNTKLTDVPEPVETKQEILLRHKASESEIIAPQVPIKEKLETHTELMLEPKAEYVEEMNDDSIEDLTLDDDDLSNMEQMDDQGAGPSHGNMGEGSGQGFGWHMGNQSQDEVFLAAQEAVGAHRDSQDVQEVATAEEEHETSSSIINNFALETTPGEWTIQVIYPTDCPAQQIQQPLFPDPDTLFTFQVEDDKGFAKEEPEDDVSKEPLPYAECYTSQGFECPQCLKTYNARRNLVRHIKLECGKEPKFVCPHCNYKNHRRNEIKKHLRNRHNIFY
ncbi:PREDICTED: longitudinals lacking protein, isoforms A/B/D/L-like isoform X3 [Nicrophorus vespilloides]|uniref:Longitudinals lacking protein, isoforms A/B/D/L-like isoform X3 n=1 Tax=Nicrophorus vespilloides TaxID=110193 RepID=A0ABM1N9K4_NICVS|nr:PREDICTED: longitudinals lacking protein, isoforms A/B/D/L-like isoform X3 [Nicrophorus vespilloides]